MTSFKFLWCKYIDKKRQTKLFS